MKALQKSHLCNYFFLTSNMVSIVRYISNDDGNNTTKLDAAGNT